MSARLASHSPDDPALQRRRMQILDAAERCFVRSGFHRTTMQDVAVEAGMSPGNLYRYFTAKDAIVAGLAERDRGRMAEDFEALAEAEDFASAFARMARKHFAEEPREKAVLCVEIWAEATRSPALAGLMNTFETEVQGRLTELLRRAADRGALSPGVDCEALAVLISTVANGLFMRRALVPSFDPTREVENLIAVVDAAVAGRIALPPRRSATTGETAP
ncbi:MAG: TetR/AcrR family transcriptional regulator [Methylobacteriaceae bacterium]|nr:TetR/AcrR family transcriptional regulator [Methylobacteriaceae bacterium]